MNSPQITGTDGECLICGEKRWRLEVRSADLEYRCRAGTWDLVACAACGHVYIHPLPAAADVAALYPATYYTVNRNSPIYLDGAVVEKKMVRDARRLREAIGGVNVRSIVDIGGGNLTRLVKLQEVFGAGAEAMCLDFQFDAAVLAQAQTAGIKLVTGNVETDLSALRDNGHDLIIMRQLIEHLRDPRAALRGVLRKLAPGGLLIIDTPNRGGLDYALFRGRHWGGYHIPRHFHLFNQPHLVRLLEETGYQIFRRGFTPSLAFWIISFRNKLGLNSNERSDSCWEFLHLKNLPVSGSFFVLDLVWSKLGFETSNQFVFAQKRG